MTTPQWFAEAIAVPASRTRIVADGVPLSVRSWGTDSAEEAVLIHGTAAHSHWWDHIAPLLHTNGKTVTAVDLSGHGDSGWRTRYTIDLWADEIVSIIEKFSRAERITLIGHSLGGLVALRAAGRGHPRVATVILVDARIRDQTAEEVSDFAIRAARPTREFGSQADAVRGFRLMPQSAQSAPYVVDHIAAHSVRSTCRGTWTWKFDPRIFAHSIPGAELHQPGRIPVVQLRAEGSRDTHVRESDILGPIVEIPASGHHIMVDEPIALATALRCLAAV